MKVSIALAAYKGEKYVGEQLASLARQTRKPDEIVITDDSPDNSMQSPIENCADDHDLAISYFHNETNLGFARNFEKALSLTTGDVVFFCDQDDSWLPEKIETMLGVLNASPELLIAMNDAEFADGDLQPLGTTKLGQIRAAGLSDLNFTMGCCFAMRRELVNLALPFPDGLPHDHWTASLSDLLGATLRTTKVLQLYRIHAANVSKGFFVNADPKGSPTSLKLQRAASRFRKLRSSENLQSERHVTRLAVERIRERCFAAGKAQLEAVEAAERHLVILHKRLAIRSRSLPGRVKSMIAEGSGFYSKPSEIAKDLLAMRPAREGIE